MLYKLTKVKCSAVLYLVLTFGTVLQSEKSFMSQERERTYNRYNVITINRKHNRDNIGLAVKSLLSGKTIALPTDTVYGVACDASNGEAVEMLYTLLDKPYYEPVPMCVLDVQNITYWSVSEILPKYILGQLVNIPVTVMLQRKKTLYEHINPGIRDIGIRVFKKKMFISQVLKRLKRPMILTSARLQNRSNSIDIEEFKELWPKIDLVFDGGKLNRDNRIGSSVVDLSIMHRYIFVRRGVANVAVLNLCERYKLTEMEANLTAVQQAYALDI